MKFLFLAGMSLLSLPVLASVAYHLLSGNWLRQWLEESPPAPVPSEVLPPVTFFRPLKANVPELGALLKTHAEALRPEDQLLLGVAPDSAEAAIAEELRREFPEREIVVIPCVRGPIFNPKIAKLVQMESFARHEHWMLCDGEAAIDGTFLETFRRQWLGCDVLTTCYRFTKAETWPQQLDAAAVLLTLWPGLITLQHAKKFRTTVGACTGFRRADIQAIGGWSAFQTELAEDYYFGQALAKLGKTIQLSRAVITLRSDPLSWGDYWRHQRRVAITYRVADRTGFAGAVLTQGVAAGVIMLTYWPTSWLAWAMFLLGWGVRTWTACAAARRLEFPLPNPAINVLIASLVETCCWMLSWTAETVWWAGTHWRLSPEGKLLGKARA